MSSMGWSARRDLHGVARRSFAVFAIATLAVPLLAGAGERRANERECGGGKRLASRAATGFDPVQGRDPQQYPPDPQVDYQHLKIELRFDDPMTRSFTATETLTFKALAQPVTRLDLDAVNLSIQSVTTLSGEKLKYHYDGEHLDVEFPTAIASNGDSGLVFGYTCREPETGMIFALPDESYPQRPLMIHTQGESELNRYWLISHDSPNERCTFEVICEAPAKYKALSNGALVSREEIGGGMARTHYRLDQPQPTYLLSLVLGEFEVVADKWNNVAIEYWVPPGQADRVQRSFGKTPKMVETFSRVLGVPYPYPKYAQSVVYLFAWGGMENTTVTTLYESVLLDERSALDQDVESLVSHELAHQWFGDMVTCKSWSHVWLNEGFATYCEFVWDEAEYGADRYTYDAWKQLREVADSDPVNERAGLFFPFYDSPDDTFNRAASNPYSKGAAVIHILRRELGDELFWKCVNTYLKQYAWTSVESDDFRKVIEAQTGRSMERFFQQWVNRSGAPHLNVAYEWNDQRKEASVSFEQKQEITAAWPAFALKPEVWFVLDNGDVVKRTFEMNSRFGRLVAELPSAPVQILIDPQLAILAKFDISLPNEMLVRIALEGRTIGSRLRAIYALSAVAQPEARDALVKILGDDKTDWTLRSEAASALGRMAAPAARDALLAALDAGIADHKTRHAATEALAEYRSPAIAKALIKLANTDPSSAVESAALRGLGKQPRSDEIVEILLKKTSEESWEDHVRVAAVEALGHQREATAFDAAMALARYGAPYRSRGAGIAALAKIAPQAEKAHEVGDLLVEWAADSQDKAASAALAAAAETQDPNMVGRLEKLSEGAVSRDRRKELRDTIQKLREAQDKDAQLEELRARVDRLEAFREEQERQRADHREQSP